MTGGIYTAGLAMLCLSLQLRLGAIVGGGNMQARTAAAAPREEGWHGLTPEGTFLRLAADL